MWRSWAVLATGVIVAGAAGAQTLLPAQSEVTFTSRQMGVPVEGRFTRFDAEVAFDPKNLPASRIALSVDTGSASFGAPETDAEVPKPAWFDTKRFPRATFRSSAIRSVGAARYEVAGRLTIKGQGRDIVVPVALAQTGATTAASGAFTIKRLDFKVGDGEWADTSLVADDVQVRFRLALAGVPPL